MAVTFKESYLKRAGEARWRTMNYLDKVCTLLEKQ